MTLPAGPAKPKILQFINFIKNPTKMLEDCQKKYGNTFTLKFPGQPYYVVISEPEDIKNLFVANHSNVNAGEINGTVFKPVLGENSLLALDGEKHMSQRKLLLPPFHGDRMKFYGDTMLQIALDKINKWKIGESLTIFEEARDITFDVILRTIFGFEVDNPNYSNLRDLLRDLLHLIKTPFGLFTLLIKPLHKNLGIFTPWAKIQKLKKGVDKILFAEIATRRAANLLSRVDILSLLIQAKDEHGNLMSNQEIRDEMITLLVAGHETTATAIAWCVYYTLSNLPVKEKVISEVRTKLNDPEQIPSMIDQLVYLDATLKETFRMIPAIPYIARLTKTDYQLKEWTLPKGVAVVPAVYLSHHNASNWLDPEQFSPERFINIPEKAYTFLPFGGSTRRCIGAAFASYEIKIILATIFLETEISLKPNYKPEHIRKGVVIAPTKGVPVLVNNKC